ncbi:MAG: TRAP transporter large permease subunit, partial [Oscillospiraceae bacterium]|nr:TRAP transporter large permease subunit [Oscillospiraceae bacterium]
MPISFLYLGIMLAVICLWFMLLKRPIYESIFVSFAVLLFVTGTWRNVGAYISEAFSTSLLYSMTVFTAMSIILTKTKIIDGAVSIILALLGRVTGGAGYVAVLASSFMGALSGSGPGNVMATGPITIPAMIKSGFPKELAGNITSASSYLGNMIPPSANIVAALGAYTALYPASGMTDSQFWLVCWGCSLWFILQRLLTVYAFCKYYKVKPLSKEELPTVRQAIRTGWQGLLLP